MNKLIKHIIKLVIGIAILFILFYKVGYKEIFEVLKGINIFYLIIALAFLFCNMLLNTLNLLIISRICTKTIKFWRMFKYYFMMLIVGLFMPGLFGQLSLILFLKRESLSLSECSAIAIIDKILMVFVVLFFSSFALFFFLDLIDMRLAIVLIFIIFFFGIFLIGTKKGHLIISKILPKRFFGRINNFLIILSDYKKHKKIMAINIFLSFFKWGIRTLFLVFLFIALGKYIPFMYIITITSIEILAAAIPISFGGLGIRESIGTLLYTQLGYDAALVMGMYILTLIIIYGIGLIALPFIKFDFSKLKEETK